MTPNENKYRWALLVILLVALAARVFAIAYAGASLHFPDSADYDTLARAILHGQPYHVDAGFAIRMPGYPILIAGIYTVCGAHPPAVLFVQALLGAASAAMTYVLAQRISPLVGVLAAAFVALDPLNVGFSAALLSEVPFTLAMLIALEVALRLAEPLSAAPWWHWPLLGVVLAIAIYLRASAFGLAALLFLITMFLARRTTWRTITGGLIAFILVFTILLPWWLRNESIFGPASAPFTRLTTLEGLSLYEAVYADADGGPRQDVILRTMSPADRLQWSALGESARDLTWRRLAWDEIRTHPARIARLALIKIGRTWSPTFNTAEFSQPWLQAVMLLWHIPIYLLAVIALLRRRVPLRLLILLAAPILYFTAVHALFLGSVRYRVPLMPLVEIVAAAGALGLWDAARKSQRRAAIRV